jgi:hypothetical protein
MTLDPEGDGLDGALQREPYLDDDGFTARVMAGLPPRRRDPRPWALGLSGAAAAVTALLVLPGVVQAGLQALAAVPWPAAVAPGLVAGAVAAAAAAIVGLVVALEA